MKVTQLKPTQDLYGVAGGPIGPAGGDLGGPGYPAPTVIGIQGTPVCITVPGTGYALIFNGTEWCPAPIGSSPGGVQWFNVKAYGAVGDGVTDDRAACQDAADAAAAAGGVLYFPFGRYLMGSPGLVVNPNTAVLGDGRESTFILAGANGINVFTITGAVADSAYEAAHASTITGIEFDANGHTGCIGVSWIGVDFHAVTRCNFRGFLIGQHYYGSLQGRTDDCKFLSNATGIKYEATTIGYWGGTLPPSRVLVSWCTFYFNTSHAIDYSGGEELALENCEMGDNGTAGDAATSAIKWGGTTGDPPGPGLVGRNLWLEFNHGLSVIEIATSPTVLQHSLTDCWMAYNDSTYSISVDGAGAAQTLVADRVHHDTLVSPATVKTFRSQGGTTYLDVRRCNGSLSGTWTAVRQEPLLDETLVSDLSQWIALRLPNLTTTQRDAIAAPTAGMLIWNTTTTAVNQYTGSAWTAVASGITGFGTPAVVLGTAAAAGAATTAVRTDATILAFDATAPTDVANVGVASAAGSAAVAARRDHRHALTYHDEVLTDGASNIIFDGGDVVMVTGVPN